MEGGIIPQPARNNQPSTQDLHMSGNRQETSLQIHLRLDATCSNSCLLVSATEHCTPKQTDMRTIPSLESLTQRQYPSNSKTSTDVPFINHHRLAFCVAHSILISFAVFVYNSTFYFVCRYFINVVGNRLYTVTYTPIFYIYICA